MPYIYASLIKKGLKKIENVPEQIKEEVQAILDAENAD